MRNDCDCDYDYDYDCACDCDENNDDVAGHHGSVGSRHNADCAAVS